MKVKQGVRLRGLTTPMLAGVMLVNSVYIEIGVECVWTSVNDSKHGLNSLHFSGNAVDFRTKQIPRAHLDKFLKRVKASVGVDFDAMLEFIGQPQEHLHVEYQPER